MTLVHVAAARSTKTAVARISKIFSIKARPLLVDLVDIDLCIF